MACRRAAAEVSVCAAAAIDATVRVDERPSHRNGTQGSEAAVLHARLRRAQNGPRMGGPGPTGEGGRARVPSQGVGPGVRPGPEEREAVRTQGLR